MAKQPEPSWRFPQNFEDLSKFVDKDDRNLWLCVFMTFFTPFLWNVICRWEHNTRVFTNLFGSPYRACACLSLVQIFCSNLRNYYFMQAVLKQATFETPYNAELNIAGKVLIAFGALFVITSFLRLGWFGTWHGDHFGILLPAKVTGFPFNVLEHPMYVGGTLNFLGSALGARSVVGLLMTFWAEIVYQVVERVEGPFTEKIYAQAAMKKQKKR